MRGKPGIPESQVVHLWQQQMQQCRRLADSDGSPVEVIYPGRLNDHRGGDFRDAVVSSGGISRQGFIEIHSRSSGWVAHGHHLDPVYNQVVLHVAFQEDRPLKVLRQDGQAVPTIILERYKVPETAGRSLEAESAWPCQGSQKSQSFLAGALEQAGESRFLIKANRYRGELHSTEPGQSLYQGVSEALGYTKNQIPFRKLAGEAPLMRVEAIAGDMAFPEEDRFLLLQAFLLGKAGLLPSQRTLKMGGDDYLEGLEKRWAVFASATSISWGEWELYKVRPGNSPVRRIIALAHLVWKHRDKGFLNSFLDLVREAPEDQAVRELEQTLVVRADPYRSGGLDFSNPGIAAGFLFLGRERAAEIAVNVILPFAQAWGSLTGDREISRKAAEIYHSYPRRAENSIVRHMIEQISIPPALINSACRQQGLLHIYKTRCVQGLCAECELAGIRQEEEVRLDL